MSDVALVTAVYGNYDDVRPFPEQVFSDPWRHLDAVIVTDNDDLDVPGWRVVYEPRPTVHPNRAAKRAKMLPWRYTDATASVWIDAAFVVTSPRFVDEVLDYADPIAQFRHPWRSCVYEEGWASLDLPKYEDERDAIVGAIAAARAFGHPDGWGLWATGCIARRHTPEVVQFGEAWLDTVEHGTYQDQVSEALWLRSFRLRPTDLPGDHLHNPWLAHRPSARHL